VIAPEPLVGCRHRIEELHSGRWFPQEFVSFRNDRRVPTFHDEHEANADRVLVSVEYALVGFVDIDWMDRRARLEIRVLEDGPSARLEPLLADALRVGFAKFDLARLDGWVTPVHYDISPFLLRAGFTLEAVIPHAVRVDGQAVNRQIWGRLSTP
jgi:hypothetical protein